MAATAPREASALPLAAAQTTLLVWLVLMLAADAAGPVPFEAGARAASATGTAVLGVFGFVVPAVLAMFPRLAPGLLGIAKPPRPLALAAGAVGASMSAAAVVWAATGESALVGIAGILACTGGALLATTVVHGIRARRSDLRVAAPSARIALPANLMVVGALAYLEAGGAFTAAVALAPAWVAGSGLAPTLAWPLHLITAGFIALSIFGLGVRMFGAFSGNEAPKSAVWLIAVAGLAAPLGIAAGLSRFDFDLVAIFGAVGLAASSTFAALVYWMRKHARRLRPAWYLLLAGSLSLVAGEALGALFGASPALLAHLALHAQVNVLGFAGLTVFGVLFFLSGGDAARPDIVAPGVWIAAFWPAAIVLRGLGAAADLGGAVLLGDAVLLVTYLVAARSSHGRRRPRKGAAQPDE